MRRPAWFWIAILLLYAVHAVEAVRSERVLWSDGAYYFVQVVQNQQFAFGDSTRAGADTLMEWPLMALLQAGVTDLHALKVAFALPAYLLTPLSLALCLWISGSRRGLMIFPLATLAAGSMNTELLVIHESRVALALFWPVLFALSDPLKRRSTLVFAAALSLPFIAAYESAMFFGPVVVLLTLWSFRGERDFVRRGALAALMTSGVLATVIAVASVIKPTHPANLVMFEKSFRVLFGEGGAGVTLSLVVLGLSALCALPAVSRFPLAWGSLLAVAMFVCASGVEGALSEPALIAVESQYRARVLNVVLPVGLSVLFLAVRGRREAEGESPARYLLGVLFVAQVALQLQLTGQWTQYLEATREARACVRGLIPVDDAIGARLDERQVSREWMRGWHHATVSFVDRAGSFASAVGPWNGYTSWQPFDPRDEASFPRLDRFGVDATPYAAALREMRGREGPRWERIAGCEN